MRNTQAITLLLLGTIFTVAVVLTLLSFGIISGSNAAAVAGVPAGSQEVAFLVPATNIDIWERLIGALLRTRRLWSEYHPDLPPLDFDLDQAFPRQSAAVPQVSVWLGDPARGKLLVRWYKISADKGVDDWIGDLSRRQPPPLAIVGGENTERARDVSHSLQARRQQWQGPAPLFLITTATADFLIDLYPKRNYRFSFTNSGMTRAVLDFVGEHPEMLWPDHPFDVRLAAAVCGAANPLAAVGLMHAEQRLLNYAMFAVAWDDDPYSVDLSQRFGEEFQKRYFASSVQDKIAYSTGDYNNPNYWETFAALSFANSRDKSPAIRQFLVLPTGTERARRYLKAVISADPEIIRNLLVVSGDSITFNQVYRDRKVAWNILELPVPLLAFSHRNPVYRDAGDPDGKFQGFLERPTEARPWATTGMQDLLLHRDVLEALFVAAYADGALAANSDDLDRHLGGLRWLPVRDGGGKVVDGHVSLDAALGLLFDADRNRREGTGEHVVLLQPQRDAQGLLQTQATITTWSRKPAPGRHRDWQRATVLDNVYYADPGPFRAPELDNGER